LFRLSKAAAGPAEAARLAALAAKNFERAIELEGGGSSGGASMELGTQSSVGAASLPLVAAASSNRGFERREAITGMLLANDIVPEFEGQPLRAMQVAIGVELRGALDHVVQEPLPTELLLRLQQLGGSRATDRGLR
jgi:hypothetical protein